MKEKRNLGSQQYQSFTPTSRHSQYSPHNSLKTNSQNTQSLKSFSQKTAKIQHFSPHIGNSNDNLKTIKNTEKVGQNPKDRIEISFQSPFKNPLKHDSRYNSSSPQKTEHDMRIHKLKNEKILAQKQESEKFQMYLINKINALAIQIHSVSETQDDRQYNILLQQFQQHYNNLQYFMDNRHILMNYFLDLISFTNLTIPLQVPQQEYLNILHQALYAHLQKFQSMPDYYMLLPKKEQIDIFKKSLDQILMENSIEPNISPKQIQNQNSPLSNCQYLKQKYNIHEENCDQKTDDIHNNSPYRLIKLVQSQQEQQILPQTSQFNQKNNDDEDKQEEEEEAQYVNEISQDQMKKLQEIVFENQHEKQKQKEQQQLRKQNNSNNNNYKNGKNEEHVGLMDDLGQIMDDSKRLYDSIKDKQEEYMSHIKSIKENESEFKQLQEKTNQLLEKYSSILVLQEIGSLDPSPEKINDDPIDQYQLSDSNTDQNNNSQNLYEDVIQQLYGYTQENPELDDYDCDGDGDGDEEEQSQEIEKVNTKNQKQQENKQNQQENDLLSTENNPEDKDFSQLLERAYQDILSEQQSQQNINSFNIQDQEEIKEEEREVQKETETEVDLQNINTEDINIQENKKQKRKNHSQSQNLQKQQQKFDQKIEQKDQCYEQETSRNLNQNIPQNNKKKHIKSNNNNNPKQNLTQIKHQNICPAQNYYMDGDNILNNPFNSPNKQQSLKNSIANPQESTKSSLIILRDLISSQTLPIQKHKEKEQKQEKAKIKDKEEFERTIKQLQASIQLSYLSSQDLEVYYDFLLNRAQKLFIQFLKRQGVNS